MRLPRAIGVLFAAATLAAAEESREELWYRVEESAGGKPAGFMRVVTETVVEDGRSFQRFLEEGQLWSGGDSGWRDDYLFDADLALVRGESRRRAGGFEVAATLEFDGRTLRRKCADAAAELLTPWTRERPCWPRGFVAGALLRRRAPWQAGLEMAAWAFEARPGPGGAEVEFSEAELTLAVRGQAARAVLGSEQTCWLVEISEKGRSGVEALALDARGSVAERTWAGFTARRVRDEAAARGGEFAWGQAGRRDPFRPALTPAEYRRAGGAGAAERPKPPDAAAARAMADQADEHLAAMRAAANLPEADRDRVMAERSRRIHVLANAVRESGDPEAVRRIADILAAAGRLYDPARAAVASARELFRDIRERFESDDRAQIAGIPALQATLGALAAGPELAGKAEQPLIAQIAEESASLERRARVKLEGYEAAKDLDANGVMVILDPEPFEVELGVSVGGSRVATKVTLRLPVSHSIALIGSGSYEEGDTVPGIEDCTVREIRANEVLLTYKGEVLRLRIGR